VKRGRVVLSLSTDQCKTLLILKRHVKLGELLRLLFLDNVVLSNLTIDLIK